MSAAWLLAGAIGGLAAAAALSLEPIAVIAVAVVAIAVAALLLARARGPRHGEEPAEGGGRGAADHPLIRALEASVERKADLLAGVGFTAITHLASESGGGATTLRARNPMARAGGVYLVRFVSRRRHGGVVPAREVRAFQARLREAADAERGILVTAGAFSEPAWAAPEGADIELIDGRHLYELLKMQHPQQFPPDRV